MNDTFNLSELGSDWNGDASAADQFFNDGPEVIDGTSAEEVVAKIEDEEKESGKEKEKEVKPEDNIDWNDDNPNPDATDVETPGAAPKKGEKTQVNSTIAAAQLLMDKGIVDYELEEGEELDEETALELLEEGFESGVENRISELLGGLPNELQALNKYVLNGGDMNDFLSKMNTLGASTGITATLDINVEKNQELVVRQMYKDDGMDDDFIDTQLESLKDTGKLEAFAKKRFEKWKEQDSKVSQQAAQQQELQAKAQREKARQYYSSLKTAVNGEFEGIKLSAKDKNEIPGFMTDRNIKLSNGAVVTPFNQNLMEVLQNETASIQLAKLLRDRKKDGTFDFSQLEKVAATKVTKEVKDNIRRNKETPRKSTEVSTQSRSLADYF